MAALRPHDDVQAPLCDIQVRCELDQRASHPFLARPASIAG